MAFSNFTAPKLTSFTPAQPNPHIGMHAATGFRSIQSIEQSPAVTQARRLLLTQEDNKIRASQSQSKSNQAGNATAISTPLATASAPKQVSAAAATFSATLAAKSGQQGQRYVATVFDYAKHKLVAYSLHPSLKPTNSLNTPEEAQNKKHASAVQFMPIQQSNAFTDAQVQLLHKKIDAIFKGNHNWFVLFRPDTLRGMDPTLIQSGLSYLTKNAIMLEGYIADWNKIKATATGNFAESLELLICVNVSPTKIREYVANTYALSGLKAQDPLLTFNTTVQKLAKDYSLTYEEASILNKIPLELLSQLVAYLAGSDDKENVESSSKQLASTFNTYIVNLFNANDHEACIQIFKKMGTHASRNLTPTSCIDTVG